MRPRVEIGELTCRIEQEHLLVLAMHLDGRRERGEFANRGHRAVNRAAATPGDAQATTHDVLVTVDETGLGERLLGTVAHDRSIRTSTAYELESGEQGGLSRAGLAREDGQTGRKGDCRVLDERYVGYVELVKHGPVLTAYRACPDRDPRKRRARRCGRRRHRHGPGAGHDRHASPRLTPARQRRAWSHPRRWRRHASVSCP